MEEIKIFAPASVANVSCGFDVLGFCLGPVGDEMLIRKSSSKGVRITKIEGQDLPYDVKKNVAGVAAEVSRLAAQRRLELPRGLRLAEHSDDL